MLAICEMQDQDVGIEIVRVIPNTQESAEAFESECEELMGWYGHRISFYDVVIIDEVANSLSESEMYKLISENADKRLKF